MQYANVHVLQNLVYYFILKFIHLLHWYEDTVLLKRFWSKFHLSPHGVNINYMVILPIIQQPDSYSVSTFSVHAMINLKIISHFGKDLEYLKEGWLSDSNVLLLQYVAHYRAFLEKS